MRTLSLLLIAMMLSLNVYAQVLTVPVKTNEEIAKEDAINIARRTNRAVNSYDVSHKMLFKSFWGKGCSHAQLIANEFGSQSATMFINSSATTAHLQALGTGVDALVPPCDVAIDMDTGIVTITGSFEGWNDKI